jgi:NAD(P)-dependent dehydrogenase (short-subunit alcohol dehydrogenase family)
MNLELTDKVALVTGASKGIGRAIATTLLAEGMRVAVVARSRALLDTLVHPYEGRALALDVDLREPGAAAAVIEAVVSHFSALDLLVNNAGATRRGDFLTLTDAEWEDGFGLKFYAAMRLSRAAWPHLRRSTGSIINIVGIGGRTGSAEFAIGGAVNAAVLNLTKALADRGVRDGVRVNAINPGGIATERLQSRIREFATERGIDESAARAQLAGALGVARFGLPEEIARLVAFLASPHAAYCQGAILDADGGQTRTL